MLILLFLYCCFKHVFLKLLMSIQIPSLIIICKDDYIYTHTHVCVCVCVCVCVRACVCVVCITHGGGGEGGSYGKNPLN